MQAQASALTKGQLASQMSTGDNKQDSHMPMNVELTFLRERRTTLEALLHQQTHSFNAEYHRLQGVITALTTQLQTQKEDSSRMMMDMQAGFTKQLMQQQKQVFNLELEVKQLGAAPPAAQQQAVNDMSAAQIAAAQEEATGLQKELASVQQELLAAQQELGANKAAARAAQEQITGLQKELVSVQQGLVSTKAELTAAQEQATAVQEELASSQQALTSAKAESAAAQQALKEYAAQVQQLQAELQRCKQNLLSVRQASERSGDAAHAAQQAAAAEVQNTQARNSELQQQLDRLQDELINSKQEVAKVKDAFKERAQQADKQLREHGALAAQHTELTLLQQATAKQVQDLKADKQQLKADYDKLAAEHQTLKAQHQELQMKSGGVQGKGDALVQQAKGQKGNSLPQDNPHVRVREQQDPSTRRAQDTSPRRSRWDVKVPQTHKRSRSRSHSHRRPQCHASSRSQSRRRSHRSRSNSRGRSRSRVWRRSRSRGRRRSHSRSRGRSPVALRTPTLPGKHSRGRSGSRVAAHARPCDTAAVVPITSAKPCTATSNRPADSAQAGVASKIANPDMAVPGVSRAEVTGITGIGAPTDAAAKCQCPVASEELEHCMVDGDMKASHSDGMQLECHPSAHEVEAHAPDWECQMSDQQVEPGISAWDPQGISSNKDLKSHSLDEEGLGLEGNCSDEDMVVEDDTGGHPWYVPSMSSPTHADSPQPPPLPPSPPPGHSPSWSPPAFPPSQGSSPPTFNAPSLPLQSVSPPPPPPPSSSPAEAPAPKRDLRACPSQPQNASNHLQLPPHLPSQGFQTQKPVRAPIQGPSARQSTPEKNAPHKDGGISFRVQPSRRNVPSAGTKPSGIKSGHNINPSLASIEDMAQAVFPGNAPFNILRRWLAPNLTRDPKCIANVDRLHFWAIFDPNTNPVLQQLQKVHIQPFLAVVDNCPCFTVHHPKHGPPTIGLHKGALRQMYSDGGNHQGRNGTPSSQNQGLAGLVMAAPSPQRAARRPPHPAGGSPHTPPSLPVSSAVKYAGPSGGWGSPAMQPPGPWQCTPYDAPPFGDGPRVNDLPPFEAALNAWCDGRALGPGGHWIPRI